MAREKENVVQLPAPSLEGVLSVEAAIHGRRSLREYERARLTLAEVSQLVWAAQGVTHPNGLRAAPSAGALYPLRVYVVVGSVEGLESGVYRYLPETHELVRMAAGDPRRDLAVAALRQEQIEHCAAMIVLSAMYDRVVAKYGSRGVCYAHMEAGLAAENVHLQVTGLGLGTVVVGAFADEAVQGIVGMSPAEKPLIMMPVGRRRK